MAHSRRTKFIFATALVLSFVMICAVAIGVCAAGPQAELRGGWQPGPDIYHPNRVIVRFSESVTPNAVTDSIERLGYSICRVADFEPTATFPNGVRFGIVELPEGHTPDNAVQRLGTVPGIMYAEKDYIRYRDSAEVIPNDTHFDKLWGLHNDNCQDKDPHMQGTPVDDADIDMPEAWVISTGSSEVVVAVIDTGCYIDHPDLYDNIWTNPGEIPGNGIDDDGNGYIDDIHGWDFFNDDNTVWDPEERDRYGYLSDEHGTHCAGTIGALADNSMGVAGINWNVRIMPLKFIGPDGGYTSDAILAIEYASKNGASVANCSWGGGGYNKALEDAIVASNMLLLCAAGNEGLDNDRTPHYPSNYDLPNIIAVAASMQNDQPCYYPGWWGTNYGANSVDIFAPGGYILSTLPPDPPQPTPTEAYAYFYGTSMATPHVTGVAALVHSLYPDMPLYPGAPGSTGSDTTVRDAIIDTVEVKPQFEGMVRTGGRLNAAAALRAGGAPVITSFDVDPTFGPPPLAVTFSATAVSPNGEIVDKWWDFGDGSDPVHEWDTVHTYETEGTYQAEFHVLDSNGIANSASVRISVFHPPVIGVEPIELETRLEWGETDEQTVTIANSGVGALDYVISVVPIGMVEASSPDGKLRRLASGGPDSFGYVWADSDNAGVSHRWIEISEIGTEVPMTDESIVEVDLPWEFPFYGENKTSIRICSNGYATFGPSRSQHRNTSIPDTSDPNDLLAAFWADLNPGRDGAKVFWHGDDEAFTIQWQDVPRVGGNGTYTFQVVLLPEGVIYYNYKNMQGTRLDEGTIGIENVDGTSGLEVAYNEAYVHDDLSIVFVPQWVTPCATQGQIAPGESEDIAVSFAAGNLPQGLWAATLEILSNDPEQPRIDVETLMSVKSIIPPVIQSLSVKPWAGKAPLTVAFSATAKDRDGEIVDIVWDFGDGSEPVTGTLTPVHTYVADGEYTASLTVTDDDGLADSATVDIVVANLPAADVNPPRFAQTIRAHRNREEKLTVTNVGDDTLVLGVKVVVEEKADGAGLEIAPEGAGGPDKFGYMWVDSDDADGPEFDWVEISDVGVKLPMTKNHDCVEVDLPWSFPFYGEAHDKVTVTSDGFLTFDPMSTSVSNGPIPSPELPNALLAVYWDYLRPTMVPADGGVFQYYDEANDRFIVEWKGLPRFLRMGSLTFQAILYPNGSVLYQYLDMQMGSMALDRGTIGIENVDGSDGIAILYNTAGYVKNELAIRIWPYSWLSVSPLQAELEPGDSIDLDVFFDLKPTDGGVLRGSIILETNDIRRPEIVVPVRVDVIPNNPPVITACSVDPKQGPAGTVFRFLGAAHDPDGAIVDKYWTFGDGSEPVHDVFAEHVYTRNGVYTATFTAVDNDGYETTESIKVNVQNPPSASWNPTQLDFNVASGQEATKILTLSNFGPGALEFGCEELPNRAPIPERLVASESIRDLDAPNAKGIFAPHPNPERSPWLPEAAGSVLKSWRAPAPMVGVWGVGVDDNSGSLVVSDTEVEPSVNYVLTSDGMFTGISWSTTWTPGWAADMAFDGRYIWQVSVGGDNGIYKMNPQTGEVIGSIAEGEWTWESQRGLAYNPDNDTFYIGGWNKDIIYNIKGESWDNPGEVIDGWSLPVGIAGLAYHPVAGILAVTANGEPDMVYFVNPVSRSIVAEFPHPMGGYYSAAGCEFDKSGNLWVASQDDVTMYLVETGLGPIDGQWFTWEPARGKVPAGGSMDIKATVDASRLKLGTHTSNMVLFTNDVEYPMIIVPVTADVAAAPIITEASVTPIVGEPPLEVTFHAGFSVPETPVASYGWDFGDGESADVLDAVHTYAAAGEYTAVFTVVDELGGRAEAEFIVEVKMLPRATIEPSEIETTMAPTDVATETVTISNIDGNAPLKFTVRAREGSAPVVAMPERVGSVSDPNTPDADGLYLPMDPEAVAKIEAAVEPGAAGNVILSWRVPSQIENPWGLGYEEVRSTLWISDSRENYDHVVTTSGTHTGTIFNTHWTSEWPADMAYDPNHGLMWQVDVGWSNGIHGLNPATGVPEVRIRDASWAAVSQRGLAYDPDTDTFYIGGWNQDIIYHIKGLDWDSPGEIIESWPFPVSIAGLAWHPDGVLWVASNADPDMIYGIDVESRAVIAQFPHPAKDKYSSAGLALNPDGNLWVMSQKNNTMYLVDTGMPIGYGISVDPVRGIVPEGETEEITVTMKAAELGKPGDDVRQHVVVTTNDPFNSALYVDITVHLEAGPTITEISVNPTIGQPPLSVTFDASVVPGATPVVDVWWDFGDGSDAVHETHAEHVYTEVGTYTARFHAVDENGSEATAESKITVKWLPRLQVEPEEIDVVVLHGTEEQSIMRVSNNGDGPMNFSIKVVPSSPVLRPNPKSGYLLSGETQEVMLTFGSPTAAAGTYTLEMMVSADDPFCPSVIVPVQIKVNVPPEAEITDPEAGDEINGAYEICWTVTDEDDDPDTLAIDLYWRRSGGEWNEIARGLPNTGSYQWDSTEVGAGGDAFQIRIVATDPSGAFHEFVTDEFTIINLAPIAAFSFTPSLATRRDVVKFVDESTDDGEIVAWHWEFGDGAESIDASPEHQYAEKGEFEITLTVTDNGGLTGTATKTIQVGNAAPIAAFSFSPSPARVGEKVEFINESTDDGEIVTAFWEFGDGTASAGLNAEHKYDSTGTFVVRLTVVDDDKALDSIEHEIEIISAPPEAAFSFTPSSATVWDVVKFTDESTDDGEIVAWRWEFGDGAESFEQSPEHQYTKRGTFTVRLTVTDDGNETDSAEQEIEIVNAPPEAAFSFRPASPTVNDNVKFTDESIDDGEIVAWHWEFGDGAESHERNPEHKYAKKGVFAVKLTVTDDGELTATAEETIEIVNLPPEVEIITPTAGQVLTGEATIEWKAIDPDDDAEELKITLEFKLVSGGDWQTIASEEPNTGKYIGDTSKLERGGKYEIRITAVDPEGASGEATSEEFTVIALTRTVVAAPNPTSDVVTFYYDIAANGTLYVYDIAGRLVHSAELSAAAHAHEWNLHSSGKPVANGVYLYVVMAGDERSEVGRLVVSR